MTRITAPIREVDGRGAAPLQSLVANLVGGGHGSGHLVAEQRLKAGRVHRQLWRAGGLQRSVILKRFTAERACVERLAIEHWLPALGLDGLAPPLLVVVGGADGRSAWHVYEDLGDWTLDRDDSGGPTPCDRGFLTAMRSQPDWDRLQAALLVMAQLHEASAGHALLGECRYWAGDLGGHFLSTSVRDALRALEALRSDRAGLPPERSRTCEALLGILGRLSDEAPGRVAQLEALGGGECLLHGDFGVRNAMVLPVGGGWAGRLIDWDHAGVGPASYDLSTLLTQIPADQRRRALDHYCDLRPRPAGGWPTHDEWNALFDTAERSRLANSVIWPALSALQAGDDSAFDDLVQIEAWFQALRPVLPAAPGDEPGASQGRNP